MYAAERDPCADAPPRHTADNTIANIESEKALLHKQLADLKSSFSDASSKLGQAETRNIELDGALTKAKADLDASSIKLANLNAVIDAQRAREADAAKRDRISEREKERHDFGRAQEFESEKKELEEKIKSLERQLSAVQEELRMEQQQQNYPQGFQGTGRSRSTARNADPATKLLAVENELIALQAENERLRKQAAGSSAFPSSPAPASRGRGGGGGARRPRSSSISGSGIGSEAAALRSAGELEALRDQLGALQGELDATLERAGRAEREKMKAENEAIAAERSGRKTAEALKEELDDVKAELKWRVEELDDLQKEKAVLEKEVEQAKSAPSSRRKEQTAEADAEMQKQHQAQLEQLQEENQARIDELHAELDARQVRIDALQGELASVSATADSLKAQLEEAGQKLAESQQAASTLPSGASTPALSESSPTTESATSSASQLLAAASGDRAMREIKRQLATAERERDALQASVAELEDALEKAEAAAAKALGGAPAAASEAAAEQEPSAELIAAQEELVSLRAKLAECEETIQTNESALGKLHAELAEARQAHGEGAERVQTLEQEVSTITAARDAALAAAAKLESESEKGASSASMH